MRDFKEILIEDRETLFDLKEETLALIEFYKTKTFDAKNQKKLEEKQEELKQIKKDISNISVTISNFNL